MGNKRLSEEQIAEIIKLYQDGSTPTEIGKQFGIFNNSVTRILRKRGIERDQLIRMTQEQIDFMIKEYTNGVSSEIIAKKLGINGTTVCRTLIKNGIAIRPPQQNKRKYQIEENYFEVIDTEEKAYFLGFMYADGNLSKSQNEIKITLQAEDRDILERFSNIIYGYVKLRESYGKLEDGTPRTYLTLAMWCEKMHDDLANLGCPPDKTFLIRFPTPNIVPTHLLWHFVRGLFDGDGCICITNPSRPRIDFSSNLIFITQLIKFFESQGIKCNKPGINEENPLSGSIQFGAVDIVKQCYHYMYDGATIFMKRKYDTFQVGFRQLEDIKTARNTKHHDLTKYGTTYIHDYNGQTLDSKTLLTMSKEDKEKAVEPLFEFYRENGFPHANLTPDEIIGDFTSFKNILPNDIIHEDDDHILKTVHQSGINLLRHFAPHFYEVNSGLRDNRMSMVDTFNDDELLREVIKNRLDGDFNMTGNMLKQGLANSKLAYKASTFNPMIAKWVYSQYTKENDIIYDYSMGFGQRLTAALSLPYKVKYIGVDPMKKSVKSNQEIFDFLNTNVPMLNKEAEIICEGSENYCDPKYEGHVALAFSCPPYYNTEKYEEETSQAYFTGYNDFINIWWRKTMQNIMRLLKMNGIFILNVKEKAEEFNLAEDMYNVAREQGLKLLDTYQVQIARNAVFGNKKNIIKCEPLFIFERA